jgi:hypothetical protein
MFMVQIQAVIEIENEECAKSLVEAIKDKYGKVVIGPYGLDKG